MNIIFKNYCQKIDPINYKTKFLGFISFILIIILLTVSCVYFLFRKTLIDMSMELTINNVSSFVEESNFEMSNIRNFAAQVYLDSDISIFFRNANTYNHSTYSNIRKRLYHYTNTDLYISSIYLYNSTLDTLCTSNSSLLYSLKEFDKDEELASLLSSENKYLVNNKITVRRINSSNRIYYTYIIYPNFNLDEAVVINYSFNKFAVNRYNKSESYNKTIIDDTGKVIISSHLPIMETISDQKYIKTILNDVTKESGIITEMIDYKKTVVSYYKINGLTYLCFTNISNILSVVDNILKNVIILLAILLIGAYILVLLKSRNVYTYFQDTFMHISSLNRNSNRLKQNNRNELIKTFFSDTLNSEIHFTVKYLEQLNFKTDLSYEFGMILFKIDTYALSFAQYLPTEKAALKYGIANVIEELFTQEYTCDVFETNENMITLLYNQCDCSYEKKLEIIKNIQTEVFKNLDITLSCMISIFYSGAENLRLLYNQILELSNYTYFEGKGCILDNQSFSLINDETKRVSLLEFENSLESCLKDANYENSCTLLITQLDSLKPINPHDYSYILMQLMISTVHFTEKLKKNGVIIDDFYISLLLESLNSSEYQDDALQIFFDLFKQITDAIKNSKIKNNDTIIDNIVVMTSQLYNDPTFCADVVAVKLNLSLKHLNTLFKPHMLISISDYIYNFRMQKAKELIEKTTDNIKDIAQMVGYTNNSHFTYNFRKEFGITPNEYRKQIQKQLKLHS